VLDLLTARSTVKIFDRPPRNNNVVLQRVTHLQRRRRAAAEARLDERKFDMFWSLDGTSDRARRPSTGRISGSSLSAMPMGQYEAEIGGHLANDNHLAGLRAVSCDTAG